MDLEPPFPLTPVIHGVLMAGLFVDECWLSLLVGTTDGRLALPVCGSPVPGVVGGRGGQAGSGMAAIRAKTATMSSAHGQDAGMRRLRRRALWVSRAGTCKSW